MIKYQVVFLSALMLIGHNVETEARTRASKEQWAASKLAAAIEFYAKERGGLPRAWDDLRGYIDLDMLASSLGEPIDDAFLFLKESKNLSLDKEFVGVKDVLVIEKKTSRRSLDSYERGRHIIVIRKDGEIRSEWVDEQKALTLLPGERVAMKDEVRQKHMKLGIKITNTKNALLSYEPLCVTVEAIASRAEMPNTPKLSFEILTPKNGVQSFPLSSVHVLENRPTPSVPDFVEHEGQCTAQFMAVLWLLPTNGLYYASMPQYLTSQPGRYAVSVREITTGSLSPSVTFMVVASVKDEAEEMFISTNSVRAFLGDSSEFNFYRQLIREHPKSRYVPWCSALLGIHLFARIKDKSEGSETILGEITQYLDKAEEISCESLIDFRVSCARAFCEARRGNRDHAKRIFDRLVERYANVKDVPEVSRCRRQIENLLQERKDK